MYCFWGGGDIEVWIGVGCCLLDGIFCLFGCWGYFCCCCGVCCCWGGCGGVCCWGVCGGVWFGWDGIFVLVKYIGVGVFVWGGCWKLGEGEDGGYWDDFICIYKLVVV